MEPRFIEQSSAAVLSPAPVKKNRPKHSFVWNAPTTTTGVLSTSPAAPAGEVRTFLFCPLSVPSSGYSLLTRVLVGARP